MKSTGIIREVEATIRAEIRPCRQEDLPALEWMGLYSRHRHIIHDAFNAQRRGDALMLLAIAANFPIAQVWIDFARKRKRHTAILWAVRTFFPLQGVGIGRQMLEITEHILRKRGVTHAELEVDHCNYRALDFYRRLGWRIVDSHRSQGDTAGAHNCWVLAKNFRSS